MMQQTKDILLSFDIEEFDVPQEGGVQIPFSEQIEVSSLGTIAILEILARYEIRATFFCTATYAIARPDVIQRIVESGHELASHGYYHSSFAAEDLLASRLKLEEIGQVPVTGYRMARMMPVGEEEIADAGYSYNSSLNPTWLPGRYNNLSKPRTHFMENGVLQIPASVTPCLRFPLFWLSCHNLPQWLYRRLCRKALDYDRYLCIYFHPWEFTPLSEHPEYKLSGIITRRSGEGMKRALGHFIEYFMGRGAQFTTMAQFAQNHIK